MTFEDLILKYNPGFLLENGVVDADLMYFSKRFDGVPGDNVLEIGCGENPLSYAMSSGGFKVTGIDIRYPFIPLNTEINFRFIKGDFVQFPFKETFKHIISISTVEHIGLLAYGVTKLNPFDDIYAMTKIYQLLEPQGRAYITVPVGRWAVDPRGWRIYDNDALTHRIIKDFRIVEKIFFASAAFDNYKIGDLVDEKDAFKEHGPNATVLLIMER